MSELFDLTDESRRKDDDPLISGLEPEPFQMVFQQMFTGFKTYMIPDDAEEEAKEEEKVDQDENLPSTSSIALQAPTVFVPLPAPVDIPSNTKIRQYPMLRCGMCTDTFVSEITLEYHEAKKHPEFFLWSCGTCKVRFGNFRQAGEHARLFHETMPVNDLSHHEVRKKGMSIFMQEITKRSSEFVKSYLHSRDKRTIMTTAYFTFAKCELQAVLTGNIGLVIYHQSKADLLLTHKTADHEDFVACMKLNFVYGNNIRRTEYDVYIPPVSVYRTLSFNTGPSTVVRKPPGAGRPGKTLRDVVSRCVKRDVVQKPPYRLSLPYSTGNRRVRQVPSNSLPPSPLAMPTGNQQEQEDELLNFSDQFLS